MPPRSATNSTLLIGALYSLAIGHAQAQTAASWVIPPAGQVCTYRAAPSNGMPYTITATFKGLVAGNYCFEIQNPRNGNSTSCVNSEGNVVDAGNWTRSPHGGWYSWPMMVGKEWEYTYTATAKLSGGSRHWNVHVKVAAFENIVASGKQYGAFKIQAFYRNMEGGYPVQVTAWYAPSSGKVVKYDGAQDFGTSELISCAP